MSRRRLLSAAMGLALPLVAACGGGSPAAPTTAPTVAPTAQPTVASSAAAGGGPGGSLVTITPIALSQTAGSYKLELRIEAPTRIYTQAQAQQANPTTGEILLSGQMPTFGRGPGAGRFGPGATPGAAFRRPGNGTPGTVFRRTIGGTPVAALRGSFRQLALYVADATSGQPVTGAKVTITVTDNTANTAPVDLPIATLEGAGKGASDFHFGNYVLMPPGRSYTVKVTVNGTPATFSFLTH